MVLVYRRAATRFRRLQHQRPVDQFAAARGVSRHAGTLHPGVQPALLLGIPLGIIAGVMRNKWQDRAIGASALLGFSMPVFWLALLLTLFSRSTLAGCR